jgi:RNA 3'-terminal phosphate cyclase (ATP)
MIIIDGSSGEGGGQILRTSLALALVTGRPFRMERIRANRSKPGLQRQHLTAVRAAVEVGQAEAEGAALNSQQLTFMPRPVKPGQYRFRVGTAGSATLVLQTILPALATASGPSHVVLEGGTHNIYAPPFDFLQMALAPLLNRMGPQIEAVLECPGFYPAGGGRLSVAIHPQPRLKPIELLERGRIERRRARGIVSRLPRHIAEREVAAALGKLGWPRECGSVEEVDSPGPGNVVLLEVHCEHVTEVFTGFGRRGVPAEKVAAGAAQEAQRYLDAEAPVGEHLADQLLLPLALAGGGRFRTLAPTTHTTTNIATLAHFLDVKITAVEAEKDVWEIRVEG